MTFTSEFDHDQTGGIDLTREHIFNDIELFFNDYPGGSSTLLHTVGAATNRELMTRAFTFLGFANTTSADNIADIQRLGDYVCWYRHIFRTIASLVGETTLLDSPLAVNTASHTVETRPPVYFSAYNLGSADASLTIYSDITEFGAIDVTINSTPYSLPAVTFPVGTSATLGVSDAGATTITDFCTSMYNRLETLRIMYEDSFTFQVQTVDKTTYYSNPDLRQMIDQDFLETSVTHYTWP